MKQSIPLAILLSSLNGLFCVLANFCLSYPDYLAKKGKKAWPGYKHSFGVWANFMLQNLSEVGSVATWFGPVALCVPVGLGSQLLLTMFFYGVVAPINHFTKDMRVGTYIIAVAVVLLPVDGPGSQDNQDIIALLQKPLALVWSIAMLLLLLYTTVIFLIKDIKKFPSRKASLILIASQGAAVVVYNSAAKMFVIVKGWKLAVTIAVWFTACTSLTISSMVAAVAVDQSKYVPIGKSPLPYSRNHIHEGNLISSLYAIYSNICETVHECLVWCYHLGGLEGGALLDRLRFSFCSLIAWSIPACSRRHL